MGFVKNEKKMEIKGIEVLSLDSRRDKIRVSGKFVSVR